MAGLDTSTGSAILKELYTPDKVQNMVYPDNAFFAWVQKKSVQFVGSQHPIPILFGNPQLVSSSANTAFTGTPGNSQTKRFVVKRVKKYGLARIDRELMLAADGDKGSFIDGASMEIDGILQAVTRKVAIELYRDGNGVKGQVASGQATSTITVQAASGGTNGNDIDNFEVGDQLVAASSATGATRSGSMWVIGVDRTGGTITVSNTQGGAATAGTTCISGLAANDYLFLSGDAPNGGSAVCVSGLDAWLPITAPTAGDNFFGVDRSADPQRLAGIRYDASANGTPIEEAFIQGAGLANKFGGRPKVAFTNYENWFALEKALGSKVTYDRVTTDNADIGFKSIKIFGGREPIDVVPDQNCPAGRAYLLDPSTVALYCLGDLPMLIEEDGVMMLRASGADAFDVRVGGMFQLGFTAPGKNVVIKLP
jgi:hypothetical protein